MRKTICEFDEIPKGYGIAYRRSDKLMTVCYIIPFNLIVRCFWDIYWRIVAGWFVSKWETKLMKAQNNAHKKGYEEGYKRRQQELNSMLQNGYKFIEDKYGSNLSPLQDESKS